MNNSSNQDIVNDGIVLAEGIVYEKENQGDDRKPPPQPSTTNRKQSPKRRVIRDDNDDEFVKTKASKHCNDGNEATATVPRSLDKVAMNTLVRDFHGEDLAVIDYLPYLDRKDDGYYLNMDRFAAMATNPNLTPIQVRCVKLYVAIYNDGKTFAIDAAVKKMKFQGSGKQVLAHIKLNRKHYGVVGMDFHHNWLSSLGGADSITQGKFVFPFKHLQLHGVRIVLYT